jgi:hypothetical protein
MSKTYADALKYFRTKLKAGPEEPVDLNLTTEGEVGPQVDHDTTGYATSEPLKLPEIKEGIGVQSMPTPVSDPEFITLPDGTKRRVKPQETTGNEIIYEWSHVMDYSSFRVKTPWRQAQLIAQWKENEALGGKHTNLRGGIKNRNCFRGCPSYQCTCEENL